MSRGAAGARRQMPMMAAMVCCMGLTGCAFQAPDEPVPPVTGMALFEKAVGRLCVDRRWQQQEALAARARVGRVAATEAEGELTVAELLVFAPEAVEAGLFFRMRGELCRAWLEWRFWQHREAALRILAGRWREDPAALDGLRQWLTQARERRALAALVLRRALDLPPGEGDLSALTADWRLPEDSPVPERAMVPGWAWARRAELRPIENWLPQVRRELEKIPLGAEFPLTKLLALPAQLAVQRSKNSAFDWRSAAWIAAAAQIAHEAVGAYERAMNAAENALRMEAEYRRTMSEFEHLAWETARHELLLRRLDLKLAIGIDPWQPYPSAGPAGEAAADGMNPARSMATAWVLEALIGHDPH